MYDRNTDHPRHHEVGPQRRRAARNGTVIGLAISLIAGCGEVGTDAGASRLADPAPSLEALAEGVIAGLAAADAAALRALRLTESEHNELVWPELPASDPAANFPVDFAWRNIQTRNAAALSKLLPRYGGRRLEFDGVECRGEKAEFETFHVMTDCWVEFQVDGRPGEHQLFKDVLVMDGGHKIFRYYSDR